MVSGNRSHNSAKNYSREKNGCQKPWSLSKEAPILQKPHTKDQLKLARLNSSWKLIPKKHSNAVRIMRATLDHLIVM